VSVKLLLDENVSPQVAERLCKEDGLDACGVRDRGLLEATDAEVLEAAFAEDRILVTKNVDDFEKLAHGRDLHAGIILLEDGQLRRGEQLSVVRSAVALLKMRADMVNCLMRILPDGSVTFEEVPAPTADP
jgi:predicted nuclease of predicted toxin-antitoxin system